MFVHAGCGSYYCGAIRDFYIKYSDHSARQNKDLMFVILITSKEKNSVVELIHHICIRVS